MKSHIAIGAGFLLGLIATLLGCGGAPASSPVASAYVTHPQGQSLSVIDIPGYHTVSNIELASPMPGSYPQQVVVTPDGSRAFVSDANTFVWAIDTKSKSVSTAIPVGAAPMYEAISPDGKRVYVTTFTCGVLLCSAPSNPPTTSSVQVIDTETSSLVSTIPITGDPNAALSGIALSPDGTRAYIVDGFGNYVWAIDTDKDTVVATIQTPGHSSFVGVAVSPDGSHVYAAGWNQQTVNGEVEGSPIVDVIDTQIGAVTSTIALPNTDVPVWIAVTPDGRYAYVTGDVGHLWVVDTTQNTTVATVQVTDGSSLGEVAINGTQAYITSGDTIYVLDTLTNAVVDRIPSSYSLGLTVIPG